MAVPRQGVVKAVRLAGNGHPAHPPGFHQTVQVAVYGAKAQIRALLRGFIVDFFRSRVVAQLLHRLHDKLPLF